MKPYLHALRSVKKWGGTSQDYQKIHDWFDQTKAHFPDMRHRAILHSSFGIFLLEQVFGINITNSDGKIVSVRDIGEQHVIDDVGTIPTIQDYLQGMPFYDWLGGKVKETKTTNLDKMFPKVETDMLIDGSNVVNRLIDKSNGSSRILD